MDRAIDAIPPHSNDAEEAVIGCMMLDSSCADRAVSILSEESFYNSDNSAIFAHIKAISLSGKQVDLTVVADELRAKGVLQNIGGAEKLNSCLDQVTATAHFDTYARVVKEKQRLREMINGATRIIQACHSDHMPAALEEADQIATYNERHAETIPYVEPKGFVHEYLAKLEERRTMGAPELQSGMQRLDQTLWGFSRGELLIVGARPGVGKSALLLNWSNNLIHQGKKVVYFSTEMNRHEKYSRLLPIMTGIEAMKFRRASFTPEDWQKIGQASEWLHANNKFIVCDHSSPNIGQLAAIIKKERPDAVCVDYLQLFRFPAGDRRDLQIGEFTKSLKNLARDNGVAMLVASQLNRQVDHRESHQPNLGDLRDSGSIEQDADCVILLYNEVGDFPGDVVPLNAYIGKNRHGSQALIKLGFEKKTQRIRELVDENLL